MTSQPSSSSSSVSADMNSTQISSEPNVCKVCGDVAHIKYYGALSCQSCKTFFRRNVSRLELIRPCDANNRCEVNLLTRHLCTPCRLAKCLTVGMSADLFRRESLQKKKNSLKRKSNNTQRADSKVTKAGDQSVVVNLLHNDVSLLNPSDWVLVSNIVHACDLYSLVPALRRILEGLSSPYRDHSRPEENILSALSSMYTSLQSLINCIPDFQVLNVDEQRSLLKRNMQGLGGSYTALMIRDSSFLNNSESLRSYGMVCGLGTLEETRRLLTRLDIDSNLLKLMLIIMAFSTNCFTVDVDINMPNDTLTLGTFRLYGSQNIYAELLWKYMIHQYGDRETIRRFAGLIKSVLDVLVHAASIYTSSTVYHDAVDEIIAKAQNDLILNRDTPVALWGKTLPHN